MQVDITGSAVDQDTIITVADLKAHLRVTHTQEDTLISALRSAAIAWVEENCNIKLGSYTARGYLPGFYNSYIPIGPVTAISEVKYQTTADTDYTTDLTTLNASYWFTDLIGQPARIAFRDYPTTYDYALTPVVVSFTAGYTTMPAPVLQAIRLLVAHMYENRQEEQSGISNRLKFGLEALLSPYRIIYQP
ncbi:MAG: hypothetical protein EBR05_09575 [Marivivens sp.]|nr:hypothetical protein [Marivivens sp.]NBX10035.1 hypothetical protein [Marivivens sp.]NCW69799.1 hypothetical protein [Marivivens sp.]